jgi:hypothetical protein
VLVLLEHVQRLQRDAGVAEADREVDLLLEHQVLADLATDVGRALVVALHELERTPQVAADFVDLLGGELGAEARAVAEVARAARQRQDEPDAQRLAEDAGLKKA